MMYLFRIQLLTSFVFGIKKVEIFSKKSSLQKIDLGDLSTL